MNEQDANGTSLFTGLTAEAASVPGYIKLNHQRFWSRLEPCITPGSPDQAIRITNERLTAKSIATCLKFKAHASRNLWSHLVLVARNMCSRSAQQLNTSSEASMLY